MNDKSFEYFGERSRPALEAWQESLRRADGGGDTVIMSPRAWQAVLGEVRDEQRELATSPAKTKVTDVLLAVLVAALHVRRRHAQ